MGLQELNEWCCCLRCVLCDLQGPTPGVKASFKATGRKSTGKGKAAAAAKPPKGGKKGKAAAAAAAEAKVPTKQQEESAAEEEDDDVPMLSSQDMTLPR
jgi:hypothetical protein